MNKTEANRFNKLYQRHLRLLKLQGKAQKTIDAYARGVRDVAQVKSSRNYLKILAYNLRILKFHANIWYFEKKYGAKPNDRI